MLACWEDVYLPAGLTLLLVLFRKQSLSSSISHNFMVSTVERWVTSSMNKEENSADHNLESDVKLMIIQQG